MPESKITGTWLCVWPDGSRSLVFNAWTVEDALYVLDETDAAEPYMLYPLPDQPSFIHFKREKEGREVYYSPYQLSEELNSQIEKRVKKRKPIEERPINDHAAIAADLLGMSTTLANALMKRHIENRIASPALPDV